MFTNTLNMDVQIHTEEIIKPSHSSLVLVPLKNNSSTVHQLILKLDYLSINLTPKDIDEIGQKVFKEWKSVFPLYPIERAFANQSASEALEVCITFDATNIFSSTQLRNITKTISELLESEINKVLTTSKEKEMDKTSATREKETEAKRRSDIDLLERFDYLKQENSELQSALQQSKYDDFSQKERIEELRQEIDRQQRSLTGLQDSNHSENMSARQKIQESLEDTSSRLRQSQQELLNKQREIQRLQSIAVENERYINSLQADYEQLREASNYQLERALEENDSLKADLIERQNSELEDKQSIQLIKSELRQVISETENIQEELKQRVQRMQIENEELRTIIKENQVFEERTHQELIETTRQLNETNELMKKLTLEKEVATKELESRIAALSTEREELALAYKTSRDLEFSKNSELLELRNHLVNLEQKLQQAEFDKKRVETTWQTRLATEEREKEKIVQQITLDKEQFVHNKEQEIKRLSERLTQQKELVDKLMANQSDTQAVWQENNTALESNYEEVYQKSKELELEVAKLSEANKVLAEKLAIYEKIPTELSVEEEPLSTDLNRLEEEIEKELAEPQVEAEIVAEELEEEDVYYDYEEEDSDYEYSYEYEDEDYDYEYHEVDDLIDYNPEQIEDDINDLFDSKDEDGKSKIRKKDFAIYELYLDNLPQLVEQAEGEDFKTFVEPKMKKFKKFKKEFEDEVKAPTLFSRKYKLETGLYNQMKAYVLMSRHLSVLLDVEISEDDYDYDYEYEDDYDYSYDYEYDYDDK